MIVVMSITTSGSEMRKGWYCLLSDGWLSTTLPDSERVVSAAFYWSDTVDVIVISEYEFIRMTSDGDAVHYKRM